MPIPVTSFPMLTPQQAMPGLAGAQMGVGMLGDLLRQQQLVGQLPYQRPTLEAQLAELRQRPALTAAQTGLAQQQARYTPLRYALQAAQIAQSQSRFGPKYQFGRIFQSLTQPQKEQLMSEYGPGVLNVVTQAGQEALGAPSPEQQQKALQMRNMLADVNIDPQAKRMITTAFDPTGIVQTTPTTGFETNEQKYQKIIKAARVRSNQLTAGAPMTNRAMAAGANELFLQQQRPQFSRMMNNAMKYAGLIGKGKLTYQQLANENPDALADYNNFENAFKVFMSNNIRLMDKMGATNDQIEAATYLFDSTKQAWKTNPVLAKKTLNEALEVVRAQAKSVLDAAQQQYKGVYEKNMGLKDWKGDYILPEGGAPQAAGVQPPQVGAGMIRVRTKKGRNVDIPQAKLQEALRLGATQVR
jgi:hypothetical protein